jgi:hypothetical protein
MNENDGREKRFDYLREWLYLRSMGLKDGLKGGEITKGLVLAHVIVLLHLVIIGALALLVVVLGGFARHLAWFFIGGSVLVGVSAVFFYRRMKTGGKNVLKDLQAIGLMTDGNVEIRLIGGLVSVSFKQSADTQRPRIDAGGRLPAARLEDARTQRDRDLAELTHLLEKNVITSDEYRRARERIGLS